MAETGRRRWPAGRHSCSQQLPATEVRGLLRSGGLEPNPRCFLLWETDVLAQRGRVWQRASGAQDMEMPTVGSSQIIFPPPTSEHAHSQPQPSCPSLPGSYDELVPGGIQSKLGEISNSRVGEVRDPGLQVWGRESKHSVTFGPGTPSCTSIVQENGRAAVRVESGCCEAPGDL